jgi:hypothetical protein
MNFRLIALASCVALGSIALGGKAQAADFYGATDTTLTSSGAMPASCSISSPPQAGVMTPFDSKTLTSDPTVTGASAATFGLTCTASASVDVKSTTSSGTALPSSATVSALLKEGSNIVATSSLTAPSGAFALASTPGVAKALSLIHTISDGTYLPIGTYNLSTIVSIIPQ